jgi:hypothetical protein
MANESDPFLWLRRLAISSSRIRLAPGVIGKSSLINLGLVVLWGIVLWRLSGANLWLDGGLIIGALIATVVGQRECQRMREFAVANPSLALMEGADITEYRKFEAQAKGLLGSDKSVLISDPTQPIPSLQPSGPDTDG